VRIISKRNVVMPVFLLSDSDQDMTGLGGSLRAMIPGLIDTLSLETVLETSTKGAKTDPSIVLLRLPKNDQPYFDEVVEFADRHKDELFLILIGEEISASNYKRLIRTHGADWASLGSNLDEVNDIIAQRRARDLNGGSATRQGRNRPVTIAFVPAAGGVGNTTLIVETAACLVTNRDARRRAVCLVDLDFQSSHICDHLDSEPRLQIAELSRAPDRLDDRLFESFRTRHASGIDIFAAPRSKFPADELNLNALDALFDMIARRYNTIFIDCPAAWFPWTDQVIAASDGAVVTGINTIPCLRQVGETLAAVRSAGSTALHVGVAINRCDRTMFGSIARRKHVEMVLRDEDLFFIANRLEAAESVNMGIPMMLGASAAKLRKDFASLAEFCDAIESRTAAAR
jgi:pilus assembly protein CpaE